MANVKSIREAFDALYESVEEAELFTQALMDEAGDKGSNLLSAYSRQVWRIQKRMEAFETLMRREAFPILDDFGAVRGYGAKPHVNLTAGSTRP